MRRRTALGAMLPVATTAFMPGSAWAQAGSATIEGDVDLIEEVLRTLHPGLLRYNTPAQVDALLAQLRREFIQATDLPQRYLALSRALARLRCGHSYANFFNQRKPVGDVLFDRASRLPFGFRWLGQEMVVTQVALPVGHGMPIAGTGMDRGSVPGVEQALVQGTVVESIDGLPAAQLLQRLLPYVRVDGHNHHKALSLLGVRHGQRLELFDVFHGLLEGPPARGTYTLELRTPQGERRRVVVPALTMAQRHAGGQPMREGAAPAATSAMPLASARTAPEAEVGWSWHVSTQGAAVLRMPGWALYNSRWDWQGWLNQRLDEVAQDRSIRGLVVDIRDNEGGLDCGHPIIERWTREPNTLPGRRLVRYRQVPSHLNPVLDTWDDSFRNWGDLPPAPEGHYFELPSRNTTVEPRGLAVQGKPLVVLVNGTNSSATFGFAQRVQRSGLGTLIGEPTGGNQRGINGGAFFFVRLPASGIEFDLPLIGYYPGAAPTPAGGAASTQAGSPAATGALPPDGGLLPDRLVVPLLEDLATGHDRALQAALTVVNASR